MLSTVPVVGLAERPAVRATTPDGKASELAVDLRSDTPAEAVYFRHCGIPYVVLCRLARRKA